MQPMPTRRHCFQEARARSAHWSSVNAVHWVPAAMPTLAIRTSPLSAQFSGTPISVPSTAPDIISVPMFGPTMKPMPSRLGVSDASAMNSHLPPRNDFTVATSAANSLNPPSSRRSNAPITLVSSSSRKPMPPAAVFAEASAGVASSPRAMPPVFSTCAVASPSGNVRPASTISARRNGVVKTTPMIPPTQTIRKIGQ